MTKENRERQYKHFRDLEHNYVAAVGRDHDLEKTPVLKKRAKENADAMLKKNPYLAYGTVEEYEMHLKKEAEKKAKEEAKKLEEAKKKAEAEAEKKARGKR